MARRDIYSYSGKDRTLLSNLIREFASDAVVEMHRNMKGIHGGDPLRFLSFHREYIGQLEDFLRERGYTRFVPLPSWNPARCVPREFRIGIKNACPSISFSPTFSRRNLLNFSSEREFGRALENRHNAVHNRVGGRMGSIMTSPSVPIFWIWHAFIDDIWRSYQDVRGERSVSGNSLSSLTRDGNTSSRNATPNRNLQLRRRPRRRT